MSVCFADHPDRTAIQRGSGLVTRRLDDVCSRDPVELKSGRVGFDARQIDHVVEQSLESPELRLDDLQLFTPLVV